MITRHIADLLYHHECVIVPGLGGFIKAYHPARIVQAANEFRPPSGTVAFNAGLAGNDGQLASYIASADNISYREALYEIKLWVDECFDTLKKNEKVVIENIGNLFINASGKLEFSPAKQVNFNADSFGLPVFFAKPAHDTSLVTGEIQPARLNRWSSKYKRLVPETLKWAAVLAPFVAFVLWGSLSGNVIDNYVHNYTGMFSWVRSTPGKTVQLSKMAALPKTDEPVAVIDESPAAALAVENITFDPGVVSYAELANNQVSISKPEQQPVRETITDEQEFYIIGGAFRDYNNALKLISTLHEQGYPAAVVDTTSGGLYVVSMKGFSDYNEAASELNEIKKDGYTSSWILKKRRG